MEEVFSNTLQGMTKESIALTGLSYTGFMLAEEYDSNPVLME
jgi:phosphoribosylamine-glycine ligase